MAISLPDSDIFKAYDVDEIAERVFKISEYGVSNCYLVVGSDCALLIDCCSGLGRIDKLVEFLTDKPVTVAATHGHYDHLGGMTMFPRLYLHPSDNTGDFKLLRTRFMKKLSVRLNIVAKDNGAMPRDVQKDLYKTDVLPLLHGQIFHLGGKDIEAVSMRGHTEGSVIFIDDKDKIMFTGDSVCSCLWMFLDTATSLEEWIETGEKILSLAKTYQAYGGHREGFEPVWRIKRLVELAKQLVKKTPRNSFFSHTRAYPEMDYVNGCILYNTKKVHKKAD